ncbi:hypothetical protein LTR74_012263 [Friedmanniomyces endolithicus]|nr:hypothetical protein LTR74_012263 [Friedmanniomyces endolithicus]
MTGTGTNNKVNSTRGSRRSSDSDTSDDTKPVRTRVPQLPSKYNPCVSCREAEAHIRLTNYIHSLRAMELVPMPICNQQEGTCERCLDAGLKCEYGAGTVNTSGRNEQEDLRYQLECSTREYQESVFLLRVFRHGSEHDAATLLARMRDGQDVETILTSLRGDPGPQEPVIK